MEQPEAYSIKYNLEFIRFWNFSFYVMEIFFFLFFFASTTYNKFNDSNNDEENDGPWSKTKALNPRSSRYYHGPLNFKGPLCVERVLEANNSFPLFLFVNNVQLFG